MNDFFLSMKQPWLLFKNTLEIRLEDADWLFKGFAPAIEKNEWKISNEELFKNEFNALLKIFQKGELQKAVPYLFTRSSALMKEDCLVNALRNAIRNLKKGRNGYMVFGREIADCLD